MGKRIFFGLATAALIALCGLVPKARLAQVPQVSIAKPTVTQYTGEIYCRGELVSSSAREVTLELPLVLQDAVSYTHLIEIFWEFSPDVLQ